MKKVFLAVSLIILPSISVFAAERSLSLSLQSNYVFRGETQTDDKAAVQANYEISQYKDSGFYAGFFGSNVAQGAEIDIFGGFKLTLGEHKNIVIDLGAVEYLYTDNNFAPISHDIYAGVQYELSHGKMYFGENGARYIDLSLGFYTFADMELLLHYGNTSGTSRNGNDYGFTLQKLIGTTQVGLSATYEDKTAAKETRIFAFVSSGF